MILLFPYTVTSFSDPIKLYYVLKGAIRKSVWNIYLTKANDGVAELFSWNVSVESRVVFWSVFISICLSLNFVSSNCRARAWLYLLVSSNDML